jgi:hypothetical protein
MAQKALYDQLEAYNSKIPNDFRDNWGSILTFLDGNDTKNLIKRGDTFVAKCRTEQATLIKEP